MFGPAPTLLHPDPDLAIATVIDQFNDPPTLERRLFRDGPSEEAQTRAVKNFSILMQDRGCSSDTPYMLKALYRRACLQEAAYIRVMEHLSRETHPNSIKKLSTTATDLHKGYLATLGAIYKLERDPNPPLMQGDYQMIDEPRPPEAIKVLGVSGAVAVEIFNQSINGCINNNN